MKNEKFDLENLPRENIFKVPDHYFDELPLQIKAKTSVKSKIVPLISWSTQRTWASLAACSIIAILGYLTLMPTQESLGNESLAGVHDQEIVNYLIQENTNQTDVAEQINNGGTSKFNNLELLDNLNVNDNDILQSIDYENIDNEI